MNTVKAAYGLSLVLLLSAGVALADGGVTFENISADPGGAGITYERVPSARFQNEKDAVAPFNGVIPIPAFGPMRAEEHGLDPRGIPGVAIFDFDNDGDQDIYVSNGPGAANALYSNQFMESGTVSFVDVSVAAGAAATDLDTNGICFGDIDNDGDKDLYLTSPGFGNRLLENQGDGTFSNITASAKVAGDRNSLACTFADVNNDGLLDLAVGNSYDDWNHRLPHRETSHYHSFQHSYLFMNTGGNVFSDKSAEAGLEEVSNMGGEGLLGGAWTWAISSFDYDQDGDVDILFADNQGLAPADASQRRGYLRLYDNDGSGKFTEVTETVGLDIVGAWMGISSGDLDCDGYMDVFATDVGLVSGPASSSRPLHQRHDGHFDDVGVGDLIGTPFGWGTSMFDYDNDGDNDIVFHGGIYVFDITIGANPGTVLQNTGLCSGVLDWDTDALTFDHMPRVVKGVAVGDLNNDGFTDVVTASSSNLRQLNYLPSVGILRPPTGSPFDPFLFFEVDWFPADGMNYLFFGAVDDEGNQLDQPNGTLGVEINSGDNGNNWFSATPRGSYGTLPAGKANRDGIGAVMRVYQPGVGLTSSRPVTGGSSFASQDSTTLEFGLGDNSWGMVNVLWPGGHTNNFVAHAGDRILTPEIPCDYASRFDDPESYAACVNQALDALTEAGVINGGDRDQYLEGAFHCEPSDEMACLNDGRFAVTIDWVTSDMQQSEAHLQPLELDKSAAFYFFAHDTVEAHVNILTGCGINDHYWVFAAASTNVEYTMTVIDTQDFSAKQYHNPLGETAMAITDTVAFATCP